MIPEQGRSAKYDYQIKPYSLIPDLLHPFNYIKFYPNQDREGKYRFGGEMRTQITDIGFRNIQINTIITCTIYISFNVTVDYFKINLILKIITL